MTYQTKPREIAMTFGQSTVSYGLGYSDNLHKKIISEISLTLTLSSTSSARFVRSTNYESINKTLELTEKLLIDIEHDIVDFCGTELVRNVRRKRLKFLSLAVRMLSTLTLVSNYEDLLAMSPYSFRVPICIS